MKKFKRLIALVTVLLFALSIFAPALAQDETTTTTEEQTTGSVYDDAAKILKDKGIMVGNESGDLMLDKSLTRAEILKMIILSTGQGDVVNDYVYADVYAEQSFTDVPNTHWAFAYVEAGKDLGIVNGYPNGTFKPDQPVKFEELCKMLVAAKGESPDAGKWPVNYVRKALDLGFFSGIEDEVGIGDVVIRGQAAVAFANAFFPPEKSIVVKDVYSVANDSIKVAVDVYLNGETATLEDGDILPMDFEIKDASDPTKTLTVTAIDSNASDFANGILVLKTAAQTAGANYKVFFKGQDTGKTFAGVALPLQVTKVEALNYKEIKVTFNRAVDNATYATTAGNYTVKIGTATTSVSNVALASDNKSVTLLLADQGFTKDDTVTVTVSKSVGIEADYTATIQNFIDTAAPTVDNVVGIGLTRLTVTFSEPVQGADVGSNYLVDGSYYAASASVDSTGKVATVIFYSPLSATTHTVQFLNIKDYAGYNLVTPVKSFTLASDNTTLTAPTVLSATQTAVKLKFNKPIASVLSVSASPSGTYSGVTFDSVDPSVVTLNFDLNSALPASGASITMSVMDASGNTVTGLTVSVVPTVDVTRPTFVTYSVDSQSQITLTFSEDVKAQGTFELKASDGTVYVPSSISWYTSSGTTYKNKLVLQFGTTISTGTYTLNISNVYDNTPLANQIVPTSITVTFADKTAPSATVYADYDSSGKVTNLYIYYSETVDRASALNPANYTIINGSSSTSVSSISSAYLTMINDKSVKIQLTSSPQSITALLIANVADLAGNKLSTYISNITSTASGTISNPPAIYLAKLTSKNTIELLIENGGKLASVAPTDFVIYYDANAIANDTGSTSSDDTVAAYITQASYDATNNKITLTLNRDLETDATIRSTSGSTNGTYVPVKVKFSTNGTAAPATKDVFGKALTFKNNAQSASIVDYCAPVIKEVAKGPVDGTIKVTLSEAIKDLTDNTDASGAVGNWFALYNSNGYKSYSKAFYKVVSASTTSDRSFVLYIGTNQDPTQTGAVPGELPAGVYQVVVNVNNIEDTAGATKPEPDTGTNNVMAYVSPYTGIYVSNAAPTVSTIAGGSGIITITFSEPVTVSSGWLTVKDSSGNAVAITEPTGNNSTFTVSVTGGASYTVTVDLTKVTDSAGLAGSGSYTSSVIVN